MNYYRSVNKPQAYFMRGAHLILLSNISLVKKGKEFTEKDDCRSNRLFMRKGNQRSQNQGKSKQKYT